MKLGKNGKNRLKIKEKAEILAKEIFQKQGNQLKRGTLIPLNNDICLVVGNKDLTELRNLKKRGL